jgi:hypothetical protein
MIHVVLEVSIDPEQASSKKTWHRSGSSCNNLLLLWEQQSGLCAYSNLPLSWGNIKKSNWTVSIELLNEGWYKKGNIVAECNSPEYCTKRFEKENAGKPVGGMRMKSPNTGGISSELEECPSTIFVFAYYYFIYYSTMIVQYDFIIKN